MKRVGAFIALLMVGLISFGGMAALDWETYIGGVYFLNLEQAVLTGFTSTGMFDLIGGARFDNVTSATTLSITETNLAFAGVTTFYGATFSFGYDVGAAMTFTTTDATGAVAITHAGSAPAITWTANSLAFTGNFSSDGTTAVLDGSTSARILSAGFTSLESAANRFGVNATIYMSVATTATTGITTITHTGTTPTVTWTADSFSFVGAFSSDSASTAVVDGATSFRGLSAGFVSLESPANRFGLNATEYIQIATTITTGITTITHTGSAPAVTWTADSLSFVGSFDTNGATVSLDGSTSVRAISAGFNSLESPGNRFGSDAAVYMQIATTATTGITAITHTGSAVTVTWTAPAFDFVGTMALDATTLSDVLTFSDAGTIDNTAADTLTITETYIALAGEVSISGDLTVTGGDIIDGSGGGATVANKGTSVETMGGAQKTVITFTLTGDHDIDTPDGGQSAGVLVYDFPVGYIQILGALIDASVVTNAAYNATVADQYYISVGTVDGTQAADADLTGTEADIIGKTTHDTDSGAGANTQLTNTWHAQDLTAETFDGTGTAIDLFVNVAVPNANNTGATTHAVTGTLTIFWINHGGY